MNMRMRILTCVVMLGTVFGANAGLIGDEVITNGDFSSGTSGWSYDGSYYTYDAAIDNDGDLAVITSIPNDWAPGFLDHTAGSGNQMLGVNASQISGADFWQQTVSVEAGHEYTISVWMANLTLAPDPQVRFFVGGTMVGNWLIDDGYDAWFEYTGTWTAGSTGAVNLYMEEIVASAAGVDFAVDDVSMTVSAVPEPATAGLFTGAALLIMLIRRIKKEYGLK